MCTSLQEILNDEYATFKAESTKMRCFRLVHLYGLVSSFVSIFLDSHIPITMSLDIITLVGSLVSLYMSRILRLKESVEGKRAASLRLATFGTVFHTTCFYLAVYAYIETNKVIILVVYMYHFFMTCLGIVMALVKFCSTNFADVASTTKWLHRIIIYIKMLLYLK